jgi:hypothetical protein
MMKRRMIPGLDNDLLTIVAIFFAAVAFMWLFIGCELFDSATRTTEQTGDAAEAIGQAFENVGEALSWGIYVLVGYVAGELRRPIVNAGKKVINGRKSRKGDSTRSAAAGKRMRGK